MAAGVMAFMEHKKKKLAEKQAEQAATEQTDTDVQAQQQGGEAQS